MFVVNAILISLRNFHPSHQQVLEKKKDRAAIMAEAWWETWGESRWAPNLAGTWIWQVIFLGGGRLKWCKWEGYPKWYVAPQMIIGWIWVNAPKQMLNSRTFFTGWTPVFFVSFPLILDNRPTHFSWRGVSCFAVTTSHLWVNCWTICWLSAGIFVEFFSSHGRRYRWKNGDFLELDESENIRNCIAKIL